MRLGLPLILLSMSLSVFGAWNGGDRVLAQRAGQPFWYPATVLSQKSGVYEVLYEDGESREKLGGERLAANDLAVGSAVHARANRGTIFYPGVILEKDGEKVVVLYDSGVKEPTFQAMLRVARAPIRAACRVGQEVLAIWDNSVYWYPGKIVELKNDRARIAFHDGDVSWVTLDQIAKVDTKRNPRVFGRWQGGEVMYPGRVERVAGGKYHVAYDDGDKEKTTLHWLVFVMEPHDALGENAACTPGFEAPPKQESGLPPPPAPVAPSELKRRETKDI